MSESGVLTTPLDTSDHPVIIADFHEAANEIYDGPTARGGGVTDQPEIPNLSEDPGVYYVNFDLRVQHKYEEDLRSIKADIDAFRSWASNRAARMIQKKIASNELKVNNIAQVSSYKAKVLSVIFSQHNDVLNVKKAVVNSDKLEVQDKKFHANILKTALSGFSITEGQIKVLDDVINSVVKSLESSKKEDTVKRQYFIVVMTYRFDQYTSDISAQIRTIAFESTVITKEVAEFKSQSKYHKVDVSFSGFDYDFNRPLWVTRKAQLKEEIDAGVSLMKEDPQFDVPVGDV